MPSELTWRVSADDLPSVGVRLRLYGCERLRRERMIGEAIVPLTTVSIEQQTPQWLVLQPRANITVSSSTENTATRLAARWPLNMAHNAQAGRGWISPARKFGEGHPLPK